MRLKIGRREFVALLGGAYAAATRAQDGFPNRSIRILVPFGAGGAADSITRLLAKELSSSLKDNVIIDNRPGAGGIIATEAVAKALHDGYTLLMASTTAVQHPPLGVKTPYVFERDLVPLAHVVSAANVLVVSNKAGVASVEALIAAARSRPKDFAFGSAGVGSSGHIQGALLNQQANLSLNHVPYKGNNPLINDLLCGTINMGFSGHHDLDALPPGESDPRARLLWQAAPALAAQHSDDGATRLSQLRTRRLAGHLRPRRHSPDRAGANLDAMTNAVRSPEVTGWIRRAGAVPGDHFGPSFGEVIREDAQIWAKVIKDTGITAT